MTVTILAIVFIVAVLAITLFGFRAFIKREGPQTGMNSERCSICRQQFDKTQLIERQIGDYRLLFFCAECVKGLYNEMVSRN